MFKPSYYYLDGNTRPSYLSPEKPVCGSGSNSWNPLWNNWLVQDRERSKTGLSAASCWFNVYTEHIMRNSGLDELQPGIKIGERNINNLIYADDTTLMAESKEELKSLLMRVKGSDRFPLPGLQNCCRWWLQPWNQKMIAFWQESNDKRRQCVEKQN